MKHVNANKKVAGGNFFGNGFQIGGLAGGSIEQKTSFEYYQDGSLKRTTSPDGVHSDSYSDPTARFVDRFLASGTSMGDIKVAAASRYFVGQPLTIEQTGLASQNVFVIAVKLSEQTITVSLKKGGLSLNVAAYTVNTTNPSASATVSQLAPRAWNVIDGVAGFTAPTGTIMPKVDLKQATEVQVDLLGRTLREKNHLTGAETSYAFDDLALDLPTRTFTKANLGFVTGNTTKLDELIDTVAYDIAGQVALTMPSGRARTLATYDELGNPSAQLVDAVFGAYEQFETDSVGNVTKHTLLNRSKQSQQEIVSTAIYDAQSRMRKTVDGESRETKVEYTFDNATTVKKYRTTSTENAQDPIMAQHLTTKTFSDAAGQTRVMETPLLAEYTYTYDFAGRMKTEAYHDKSSVTDKAPDRSTAYTFDPLGRLRQTQYQGSGGYSTYVDYYLQTQYANNADRVIIDGAGAKTAYLEDSLGQPVLVINDDPGKTPDNQTQAAPIQITAYSYLPQDIARVVTQRLAGVTMSGSLTLDNVPNSTRTTRSLLSDDGRLILQADQTDTSIPPVNITSIAALPGAGFTVDGQSICEEWVGCHRFLWELAKTRKESH